MTQRPAAPRSRHGRAAAIVLAIAAGGCALLNGPTAQAPRFYVLTPAPPPTEPRPSRRLVIGLGPVQLPPYLDRPEMVARVAPNQITFDDLNRWGEPLKDNLVRVLAANLDEQLDLLRVVPYPWYKDTPMDYAVSVAVGRFEPQPDGHVMLIAHWRINESSGDPIVSRDAQFSRPGGSPAETAAAMSELVGELSDTIASALRELEAKRAG